MSDRFNITISNLRANLYILRQNRLNEVKAIKQLDDELGIVQDFIQQYAPSAVNPAYNSLYAFAKTYNSAITDVVHQSERVEPLITSGSYILSGTASYFTESYPQALPTLVTKIEGLRNARNDREVVYVELEKHNKVIADTFLSAWQSLESPAIDQTRGPAFLMRETITQFFHHFAPDNLVKSKIWYKPHDEKTDITQSHRIRFILEEQIKPDRRNSVVELQLQELKKVYGNLNKAHNQAVLGGNNIKPFLYQAQDLFKGILQIIKPAVQ